MDRYIHALSMVILLLACKPYEKAMPDNLRSTDTTAILQQCFNSSELKDLYAAFKDSSLKLFMNGYVLAKYKLSWGGKPIVYLSPIRNHICFSEGFIVQIIWMKVGQNEANISFWLERQGSGADFKLSRRKDNWLVDSSNIYLY